MYPFMKKILLSLLALCALSTAIAQEVKCGIDTRVLVKEQIAAGVTHMDFLAKMSGPEFDRDRLLKADIVIGGQAGNIVSLQVPVKSLRVLEENREVVQYSVCHPIAAPHMENTRIDTRTNEVQAGEGTSDSMAYDGTGVYIGITDWGFDYTNPNFRELDGDGIRIDRAWDHFRKSGPAPAGYNYGTEIVGKNDLLRYRCDTANIYDFATHGSHVAGIAAGSGMNNRKYHGQAPGARLLMCTFGLNESNWMDGVAWMAQVARNNSRRLVVNSSWGMYSFSCLDGMSLLDQAIDNMSEEGVVFITSAGNNGDVNFHISRNFSETPDTLKTVANYYNYSETAIGQTLIIWGEEGCDFDAYFRMKSNDSIWVSPLFKTGTVNDADTNVIYDTLHCNGIDIDYRVMVEHRNPFDHRPHIQMDITKNTALQLQLFIVGDSGNVHAWNLAKLTNDAGNMGAAFTYGTAADRQQGFVSGNHFYGIGEPACARSVISVAAHKADFWSYDHTQLYPGYITSFSSYGPLIDGTLKPEISAPGKDVISSLSHWTTESYTAKDSMTYNGRIYRWASMQGTSMSCPAVTGIVALMLQANPYLGINRIKDIIATTARSDQATAASPSGPLPNNQYGAGKIDALNAVNKALSYVSIQEVEEFRPPIRIYPNPSNGQITVNTGCGEQQTLRVYTTNGHCLMSIPVTTTTTIDTRSWNRGIYILRVGSRTEKLIVQ